MAVAIPLKQWQAALPDIKSRGHVTSATPEWMDAVIGRIAVLLLVCFASTFALAGVGQIAGLRGFVVNVSDDCRLIVSIDHEAEIIRLAGIDLVDGHFRKKTDARDFVRSRVMAKTVEIELVGKDSRGNLLGKVYIDNSCLNEALIRAGLARQAP
jgi:endonuclease YncB( thermonuclease family)